MSEEKSKVEEDVTIQVTDKTVSRLRRVTYNIKINQKGQGRLRTKRLNGYLEAIILPKHLALFQISINSFLFPDWEVFNLRREDPDFQVLPIRMQLYAQDGRNINQMGKIPLYGSYQIAIESAVPNSQMEITLLLGG